MDIAQLGLKVDTSDVKKARDDLGRFTKSADEAGRSADKFEGPARKFSGGLRTIAASAGALGAAVGVGAALSKALTDARQFSRGLAEVSTLIEGTPAQMNALAEASKNMAGAFGTTSTEQVNAFYQAISAGASTVEQAQSVLDAANRFAVGGVTNVTTGVDALTTAMNAYAASGLSAEEASDAMFVGIRAGKTTADELASALGKVVPISSALGVSFDEVVGSTAALTKQGVSTSEAVTGIRQALSGILKPTKEAADEAERLGLNFSAEALADQGLTAFLVDVAEKTGGSQESLSQLFGSVEALNTVMALTSQEGGAALAQIMDDMEGKAGQTQAAYEKMADSMDNRLSVATSKMSAALLEVGEKVLPLLVPIVEAAADGIIFLVDQIEAGAGKIKAGWDALTAAFDAGGIEQALDLVVGYVEGLGSRLVQALKDAGRLALEAALSIGSEIINGISTGIDRKFQELKDKITGLGVYLPEWLKDMLGIASPSKVFAEIGEWTVEGLIVGMDDREDALRTRAETLGATMGEGIKDGLDPVLRTVFDGLAKGDLGSIGSGLLGMAQQGFSNLLQTSFTPDGGGLSGLFKGITGAFTGIGANYRGAGGGIAGIGSAISGLLPGIGAISSLVGVVKGLIGETQKNYNFFDLQAGMAGLSGTRGDNKTTTNIFGSSNKNNTSDFRSGWTQFIAQDLDQSFADMRESIGQSLQDIGLDVAEFSADIRVQFQDNLSHDELMAQLEAGLAEAGEAMIQASLAAAGLSREGETGSQTLAILNDSVRVANASLRLLDQTMFDVSAVGAGAARELIELAGGMDAFVGKTTFVFDNFLTETERTDRALQIATENMAAFEQQAGITLPATHAEFMALLDAQDLNTVAGRNLYTALLDVADEFVTVNGSALDAVPVLEDAAEAIEDVADNSRAAADAARELAAQQREQESLLHQIARMTGNVAYIRQQELAALNKVNRPLQEHIHLLEDQTAAVEAQNAALRDALATAQEALSIAEGAFDSAVNVLRGLVENAEEQLSAAEDAARRAFDAQADTVRAEFGGMIDAVNTAADAQITLAQEQVDAINAAREEAAERAAADAVAVRDQISLLEGMLSSLESALDNRRALTPEGRVMELAQAQAFLSNAAANGGTTDADGLERALAIVADPSTDLFKSFEDYQFDFQVNTGFIRKLRDLTDDALTVEEKTLAALEDQIEKIGDQITATNEGAADTITAIEDNRDKTIAALQLARDDEIAALNKWLNEVLGINDSILDVATAIDGVEAANNLVATATDALAIATGNMTTGVVASLGAIATALTTALAAAGAVTDATSAVDDAQTDIDNAGGAGGGSIFDNMNSAEKALYSVLNGLAGAEGAALLGADAFGYFSEDNTNAILSDAGVAALSGLAGDIAGVFEDTLGRNVDVAGLEYYIGQVEQNGLTLDAISTDVGSSVEALTLLIPGFSTTVSDAIYGINAAANVSVSAADVSATAATNSASASATAIEAADQALTAAQAAASSAASAASAAASVPFIPVPAGVEVGSHLADYFATGNLPSYANGTDFHPGGFARLHENEMVNLPRGTGVSTAGEVSQAAVERKRTNELLAEVNERLRYLQDKERVQTRIMNDWNINGGPGTRDGAVVKTEAAS